MQYAIKLQYCNTPLITAQIIGSYPNRRHAIVIY